MSDNNNFINRLDDVIFRSVLRSMIAVQDKVPTRTILESFLQTSFEQLTPEQQVQIVETMGTEWYFKIAARMEKRIREIDKTL